MDWQVILTLFGSFGVLLFLGLPVSFAIGLSSLLTIAMTLPLDTAITVVAQRMAVGMDNFALLAIPFFILAGNIMNQGGIAERLINLAKVLGGRLPGSLAHVNITAKMHFGAISGSAAASAAAVGGSNGRADPTVVPRLPWQNRDSRCKTGGRMICAPFYG